MMNFRSFIERNPMIAGGCSCGAGNQNPHPHGLASLAEGSDCGRDFG